MYAMNMHDAANLLGSSSNGETIQRPACVQIIDNLIVSRDATRGPSWTRVRIRNRVLWDSALTWT
jgi:hypothetical protein